jgi:hypothetical protein
MSNAFDVNILVNGNRCKQYHHDGKTFIEAKNGSEYVIEIKNNTGKRILARASVDSLSVLTGEAAVESGKDGYVIDAYHSEKIKGFRFSDDEWAMFKFGHKMYGKTYAQSKEDGSEKNCGIIGVMLHNEVEKPVVNPPIIIREPYIVEKVVYNPYPYLNQPTWYSISTTTGYIPKVNSVSASYTCNSNAFTDGQVNYCSTNLSNCNVSYAGNESLSADSGILRRSNNSKKLSNNIKAESFDMGTEWGRKEESRVTAVPFDKGVIAFSLDIYYASRESLIEMGVPLTNKLKTNLPQSFQKGYAKPPAGWQG